MLHPLLRRVVIAGVLASSMALAPARVSTAQDLSAAYKDLATASDHRVRMAAALELGRSKSPGARGALEKALKDKHLAVRAAAAAALGSLGDSAAVPALQRALGSETVIHVKTQIETTLQKISKKPAAKVKFLVVLGKFENKSSVKDSAINGMLRDHTRAKVAQIPGVELLADGADVGAESKNRKLPGFAFDGLLTQLNKGESGPDITYAAKVEFLIRKMPEQSLKGSISGAAKALADAKTVRGPSDLSQLQKDAVAGAVESALKGTTIALEAAAGK
jgi:hypothetical protein